MNPPPPLSFFLIRTVSCWWAVPTPTLDPTVYPLKWSIDNPSPLHSTPLLHQGCVDEAAASAAAPAAAKLVGTEPQDLCLVLDLSQLPYSSLFMKKWS
jgi:hypothetical protein